MADLTARALYQNVLDTGSSEDGINQQELLRRTNAAVQSIDSTGHITLTYPLNAGTSGELVNVKAAPFLAVGDGVTDDTAAISAAKASIGASGGVLYFPPGTYLLTGTGILLNKSNLTFRGAGMFQSILKRSAALHIMQPSGVVSQIAVEDLGFDASDAASGTQINFSRYSTGFRISRCWFSHIGGGSAITLTGIGAMVIEDCYFQGNGQGLGTAILIGGSSHDLIIRGNRFWYVDSGVIIDTGSTATQHGEVAEYITIEDNDFDLGWFLLPARFSGSGGTVTYTSTVLTDTGAAFSGIAANDHVRVMPVKQTGTGAFQNSNTKVTDTSATFVTNLVRRGDILKTGTAFGVIRTVESETILWVEDWLSDTDRSPVAIPAGGAYTVYGVILGKVLSTTATTATVVRWHDFDHNNPLPAAGTRYEVQYNRSNYAINAEQGARYLKIVNNRVKRGYSDQISVYGYRAQIIGNTIEDGEDMGITLHGQENIVANNYIRHQGAAGLWMNAEDSVVEGNIFTDTPWENPTDLYLGHIVVSQSSRSIFANNQFIRGTSLKERYGIVLYAATVENAAADNVLNGNMSSGMLTADYKLSGAYVTGTKLFNNVGTVLVVDSATIADLQGSNIAPVYASGFGTGRTFTGTIHSCRINVGTGGVATGGVFTLPAMANGWNCTVTNLTATAANRADQRTVQTASTTTTVTIQNQTISTGAALAWTASDILAVQCIPY